MWYNEDEFMRAPLCNCKYCSQTRRIDMLVSSRRVRKKELRRELKALWEAYFEVAAELSMVNAAYEVLCEEGRK